MVVAGRGQLGPADKVSKVGRTPSDVALFLLTVPGTTPRAKRGKLESTTTQRTQSQELGEQGTQP